MLLMALFTVAFTLYTPILIGEGVDTIIGPGNIKTKALLRILGTLAMVVLGTAVTQWIMNLLTNQVTYGVVQDIRSQAFSHLQEVPVSYIDSNQPGDILSRIVADVSQFSDGLLMGIYPVFYRCDHHFRNHWFYDVHQCEDFFNRYFAYTGFFICCQLYCRQDLSDV